MVIIKNETLEHNEMLRYKTLIFDFDGTIHNTLHIYYPAFLKGYQYLVDENMAKPRTFSLREVSIWLGYNSDDMWQTFMPDCPKDYRDKAKAMIGDEMRRQLEAGNGVLYHAAQDVLTTLVDKGYQLVFLSNCNERYMDTVRKVFELDRYFYRFICSSQYDQAPKSEILKDIKQTFDPEMVMIGDRFHDIEAGIKNDISTIGCLYGYGEPHEFFKADKVIHSISELLTLL